MARIGPEDSTEASEAKETETVEPTPTPTPTHEINGEDSTPKTESEQDENNNSGSIQSTFTFERLQARSSNPVTGIDFKRREAYLSDEEFKTVFGMMKEAFYKLPKWKQDMLKRKVDLF